MVNQKEGLFQLAGLGKGIRFHRTSSFCVRREGLSAMLRKVENGGIPRGIVVCRQAPLVSYLLFADEYIVFGKASKEEGFRLLKILEVYEKELGQKLNREKTSLFFSKNTSVEVKEEVKDMFRAQASISMNVTWACPLWWGKERRKLSIVS